MWMGPLFYLSFFLVKNSSLTTININLYGIQAFFSFTALTMAWAHRLCLFILDLSLAPLECRTYEDRDFGLGNIASSVP